MRCPACGLEGDKVIDSRSVRDGQAVRRRRECAQCQHRYTTYEVVERAAVLVSRIEPLNIIGNVGPLIGLFD